MESIAKFVCDVPGRSELDVALLRRKLAAPQVGGANQFLTSLVTKIMPAIPTAVDGRGDVEVAVSTRLG